MLEIKVEIDKQEAQEYLKEHGDSCDVSDKLVMCAYDEGKLSGVGAISMTIDHATVETVCCQPDLELVVGKALLNLIDLGGIEKVYCLKQAIYPLARRLGFHKSQSEDMLELDLTGYFTEGCHTKNC